MHALSPRLLDRDDTVFVIVDVQERLAHVMERRASVVSAAELLLAAAPLFGLPVIVTRQYPEGLGDLVAELRRQLRPETVVIDKTAFCCLADEDFKTALDGLLRRQAVVVGMEAHICVAQTVLAMLAEGWRVHVPADGVCSRRDADRDAALARLREAGAEVTTAESVVYELAGRAATEEFRALLRLVKERDATD